ncbi:MAG: efflux RND transporter periplasmic adaptor subunit [Bdellovibrionales bacterium]|nr:efflux RND transporter periplasmic adaptor subunit [Bdellovibrionales bacterium]
MKNKVIGLSVLVVVLGIGGVWWLGHSTGDHSVHQEGLQPNSEKYICPMHPQIISDKPGACPICGMDLVKSNEKNEPEEQNHDEHHGDRSNQHLESHQDEMTVKPKERASVKLSLNKQQMIGVKVYEVQEKNLFKSIKSPGRMAFDPELYTAQSEYLEALRQWNRVKNSPIADVKENTRQMIKSSKIRLKVMGLSDDQIQNLTQKGFQSEGLLVGGQDNIIYADVFEIDLPYIKENQSAQISANFLQGKTLPGKVISVDQVINPETRTAKVRIKLLKNDPSIRPESYVNATIFAPLGKHVAVPLEAIMDTGVDTYIFVKIGKGIFEPKKIRVVLETETEAAILGAIKPGDTVVVGANFLVDSESRLKSVIQGESDSSGGHNRSER